MIKSMQYVIVILVIFGLQVFTFVTFELTQKGSPQEQKKIALLENKIRSYEVEKEAFHLSSYKNENRSIASVQSETALQKNIDLGGFYFSRYLSSKTEGATKEVLTYLTKIQKESLDSDLVAKATYLKIEETCRSKMTTSCLSDFEFLIDQFPDSKWTRNSLYLLKDYYKKTNRKNEVTALNHILKNEFGEGQKE